MMEVPKMGEEHRKVRMLKFHAAVLLDVLSF